MNIHRSESVARVLVWSTLIGIAGFISMNIRLQRAERELADVRQSVALLSTEQCRMEATPSPSPSPSYLGFASLTTNDCVYRSGAPFDLR